MAYYPKAILFDWDQTLVETWPIIYKAIEEVFKNFGKPEALNLSPEELKKGSGGSAREFFPKFFKDQWQEAYTLFYKVIADYHLQHLRPINGALDLLNLLKGLDIPLGVVSNKKRDVLRKEISHLQWGDFFKVIIGSLDAEKDKPSPLPIYKALENISLDASQDIWFVGDSEEDRKAANQSGCFFIGVGGIDGDLPEQKHTEILESFKLLKS